MLLDHRIEQGKTAQLIACLIYEERSKCEALTAHPSCHRCGPHLDPHPESASWLAILQSIGRQQGTKEAEYATSPPEGVLAGPLCCGRGLCVAVL